MHQYTEQNSEAWGSLRQWFVTEHGKQPVAEALRMSEKGFVRRYSTAYREYQNKPGDEDAAAEELRCFHRSVSTAAHKAKHVFFSLYGLTVGEMPEKAGVLEDLPDFFGGMTSYSELFSGIAGADGAPDLFSPIAYYADLLRIIETYITSEFDIPEGHRLRDRRPDLYVRPLTKENTETLIPYTDIIKERLSATLQALDPSVFGVNEDPLILQDSKIEAYCAEHVYPVALPFSKPYRIVAAALTKDGFTPSHLLPIFREDTPKNVLTAASLGISVDDLTTLELCDSSFYPELADLADWSEVDVRVILRTTGLSLEKLDDLFGRGIESSDEFKMAAPGFYINKGLTSCLQLSEDSRSVLGLTRASVSNLVRFVRFAALTGLTFDQLDAMITDGDISSAVSRYAAAGNMKKGSKVLLPLISSLYAYGPSGTFEAVYGDRLSLDRAYDFSSVLPAIASVLKVSEQEVDTLCTFLFPSCAQVSALQWNALYRNTYMADVLSVRIDEYITIAELADIKPEALCGVFSAETLSALAAYSELCSMNAYEARYICTGSETSYSNSGFKDEDFITFLNDLKGQTGAASKEKRSSEVRQRLIVFLDIKQALAESVFSVIPPAPAAFESWEETFYEEEGRTFAYNCAKRLARAKLLLYKIPADVFQLFAGELFTDDFAEAVPYPLLVSICRAAKYYASNPVFFMLAADSLKRNDKAVLAALCSLSEADLAQLIHPLSLSLSSMLQFADRLDTVKTLKLSVSNLMAYLDALTKEEGYGDLLLLAARLPVPAGLESAYCSALTALTVQRLSAIYQDISTPEALSAYLLSDVQTDEAVQVSYIREGINAALTYLNRCRSGLEPGVGRIADISEDYWSWIMDFSEWKANRMVFVSPENYLLPDIRSSQSSIFKEAVQKIAGKPLDLAAAESLYAKYLDDYAELSTVVPCASYLASRKDTEELYLFGRTQAANGKLYYCIRNDQIWGEWTEISMPIPDVEITPIFIFGKLYIFWVEKSSGAAPEISYTPPSVKSGEAGNEEPVLLQKTSNVTKISVKYTCRSMLGSWSAVQTLFDGDYVVEDADADYGRQFKNTYDIHGEGYQHLTAFRITERNFCDASGRYYISQGAEFEKLLIMYGGFVYNFPDEIIENYYPLDNSFDTQDKAAFSKKHASICDKINILSRKNISGRLCSGCVRIYGSTLREENIVADGEFLLFDEYTGGTQATAAAVTTDESSSIISTVLTADVLSGTLVSADKITPKFVGQKLPEYTYTLAEKSESGVEGNGKSESEGESYSGEFLDTLNTYVMGPDPGKSLQDFQIYLKNVSIARFSKSNSDDSRNESGGKVQIDPRQLGQTTFYAPNVNPGVRPSQFGDLYSILLQCLGSQNLFGSIHNRLASEAEIIKTVNLAGGFILKIGGKGGEVFLLTPAPAKTKGKPAQLSPTDCSIVISYPKITADDIEAAIGDKEIKDYIFDELHGNVPPIIDIDGYVYMPNVSEANIVNALKRLFGDKAPEAVKKGLLNLLENRRLASNYMFWSQNVERADSTEIFAALTDHEAGGYAVLPVNETVSMNLNPKVKLRNTKVIGTKTPPEVSTLFNQYINSPLPVSFRYFGDKGNSFDVREVHYNVTRLTNASLPYILPSFCTGGVGAFLSLENQQMPVPAIFPIERFSPNTEALNLPSALDGAQPDFDGLYRNYNYELFYHLPIFAVKTLRDFGNYSDAKKWLEYIYSPLATETFLTSPTFTPVIPGKEERCLDVLTEAGLTVPVSVNKSEEYRVKYGFCYDDFVKSGAALKLLEKGLLPEEIENVVAILSNHTLGGSYSYCWRFFPFRTRRIEDLLDDLKDSAQLRNYHNNPFDPHAIASLRIGAYEKYTVLEYADLLIEWGDREFAKLTWDSIANASNLYQLANDILGKRPAVLSRRASDDTAKSFDDLYFQTESVQAESDQTESAHALKLSELLEKLTLILLNARGTGSAYKLPGVADTEFFFPYFKIPVNEAVLARWDLVADRLMKIRNNLDMNGNPRQLPLFPAAADPLLLARTRAAGYSSSSARRPTVMNNWYRYTVLYSCAKEFTSTLIQFSSQLLSSIERGDNEELLVLSSQQSAKLTAITKVIRKNTADELEKEREVLELAKAAAQSRVKYYNKLVAENISEAEQSAIDLNSKAEDLNMVSAYLAFTSGTLALIPDTGSPFAMVFGGKELSGSTSGFSRGVASLASAYGNTVGTKDAYAGYSRRLDEWRIQESQANRDIKDIDLQLEMQMLRQNSARREQESTELLDRQNAELLDFYQRKFSSQQLYSALSGILRRIVFNSYQTAIELSARAEMAWQEENDETVSFLTYTYWDDAKCGLLSGEALLSALETMHSAYIAKNPRRLEITKTVSLKESFPLVFAQLQSENVISFTLPLSLFDDDKAPADCLHKIRSISVSTQLTVGENQNISARLTQTGSVILTDPKNQKAVKYVAEFDHSGAEVPDGVIANRRSGQTINLSSAQDDCGMHSCDPCDGAYLPFEGTGAVSKWHLEYGQKNPFSPKDINDIILHIAYTALPSGRV